MRSDTSAKKAAPTTTPLKPDASSMKVFGISGHSGSGKTILIERLVPIFTARNISVSVIKHTHHDIDLDPPGKDSWRHRKAGAQEVMLVGPRRWTLFHELQTNIEPTVSQLINNLSPCDLVLIEGFKHQAIPKIEVFRAALGKPAMFPEDPWIVGTATDSPIDTTRPTLDLNQPETIADFILEQLAET